MNAERLVGLIAGGFHALFEWDAELFDLGTDGVNEQTITFRLGIYFHSLFDGYHVDCEYNRIWDEPKACVLAGKQSMKPDIIVHRRNSSGANLFCLEAKKNYLWNNKKVGFPDMGKKLVGLTHPDDRYRYVLGLAWRIMPSPNPAEHQALWFINGVNVLKTSLAAFESEVVAALRSHNR
jgi:hypothetical protein